MPINMHILVSTHAQIPLNTSCIMLSSKSFCVIRVLSFSVCCFFLHQWSPFRFTLYWACGVKSQDIASCPNYEEKSWACISHLVLLYVIQSWCCRLLIVLRTYQPFNLTPLDTTPSYRQFGLHNFGRHPRPTLLMASTSKEPINDSH